MDHLPEDNDPGCPAGFAHGLVTGVAPDIDPRQPREALSVCARAGTRFQRYSCIHGFGHAFMRIYEDRLDLALPLCKALGPQSAPDCAQGAYHDYWLAVLGADDASAPAGAVRDPRALCAAQPAVFVKPCWYRSFLENRSEGFVLETPRTSRASATASRGHSARGASRRPRSSGRRTPPSNSTSAPVFATRRTPRAASAGRRCRTCSTLRPGRTSD
jgi:hypothetical protein